jgi:hypothetical protein
MRLYQRILVAIVLTALAAAPLSARGRGQEEDELARCIAIAAGGRKWLERTLWGLRDQEGGWVGAEVKNTNGSHDLGPLQINSWWVPKLAEATNRPADDVRRWLVHDRCFNVNAARWIFMNGLAVTHNYWKAIGSYHSPSDHKQLSYAASVAENLRRRFGPNVFSGPGSRLGRVALVND